MGAVRRKDRTAKPSLLIVLQRAMEVMQFSAEEVREVLRLLAGVLHLGNVEFITAGGAQVSFKTGKRAPPPVLALAFSTWEVRPALFIVRPFVEKLL